MPVVSQEVDLSGCPQLGMKVRPEVHRALKVAAAVAGETMEQVLHRILVRALNVKDIDPAPKRR